MADPIWPILVDSGHFLDFELNFILHGGTSQISAHVETKYRCYTKTSFED